MTTERSKREKSYLSDIVDDVYSDKEIYMGVKKVVVDEIVRKTFLAIAKRIVDGYVVKIVDFGAFWSSYCKPRNGRNPLTGESIRIEEKMTPRFRPTTRLKTDVLEKMIKP